MGLTFLTVNSIPSFFSNVDILRDTADWQMLSLLPASEKLRVWHRTRNDWIWG